MPKASKYSRTTDFDYHLPTSHIAQTPTTPRDHARLLVMDRLTGELTHGRFDQVLDYFETGDVLVLNDSKVIPARLFGTKETGGKIEIFLLTKIKARTWQVLVKGKVTIGTVVNITPKVSATIISASPDQQTWVVRFNAADKVVLTCGETPLPPYIKQTAKMSDYQTVYARTTGSVAAPTAGLHFTKRLLAKLKRRGVKIVTVTLHVGMGTFQSVKTELIADHVMHAEWGSISPRTAKTINDARKKGNKIIACGTTSIRTLEAFAKNGKIKAGQQWIDIFIHPGYRFRIVDAIITNFHLPKSTLIMLVSAFAGYQQTMNAYQTAIEDEYKFYSFGDAMLIR